MGSGWFGRLLRDGIIERTENRRWDAEKTKELLTYRSDALQLSYLLTFGFEGQMAGGLLKMNMIAKPLAQGILFQPYVNRAVSRSWKWSQILDLFGPYTAEEPMTGPQAEAIRTAMMNFSKKADTKMIMTSVMGQYHSSNGSQSSQSASSPIAQNLPAEIKLKNILSNENFSLKQDKKRSRILAGQQELVYQLKIDGRVIEDSLFKIILSADYLDIEVIMVGGQSYQMTSAGIGRTVLVYLMNVARQRGFKAVRVMETNNYGLMRLSYSVNSSAKYIVGNKVYFFTQINWFDRPVMIWITDVAPGMLGTQFEINTSKETATLIRPAQIVQFSPRIKDHEAADIFEKIKVSYKDGRIVVAWKDSRNIKPIHYQVTVEHEAQWIVIPVSGMKASSPVIVAADTKLFTIGYDKFIVGDRVAIRMTMFDTVTGQQAGYLHILVLGKHAYTRSALDDTGRYYPGTNGFEVDIDYRSAYKGIGETLMASAFDLLRDMGVVSFTGEFYNNESLAFSLAIGALEFDGNIAYNLAYGAPRPRQAIVIRKQSASSVVRGRSVSSLGAPGELAVSHKVKSINFIPFAPKAKTAGPVTINHFVHASSGVQEEPVQKRNKIMVPFLMIKNNLNSAWTIWIIVMRKTFLTWSNGLRAPPIAKDQILSGSWDKVIEQYNVTRIAHLKAGTPMPQLYIKRRTIPTALAKILNTPEFASARFIPADQLFFFKLDSRQDVDVVYRWAYTAEAAELTRVHNDGWRATPKETVTVAQMHSAIKNNNKGILAAQVIERATGRTFIGAVIWSIDVYLSPEMIEHIRTKELSLPQLRSVQILTNNFTLKGVVKRNANTRFNFAVGVPAPEDESFPVERRDDYLANGKAVKGLAKGLIAAQADQVEREGITYLATYSPQTVLKFHHNNSAVQWNIGIIPNGRYPGMNAILMLYGPIGEIEYVRKRTMRQLALTLARVNEHQEEMIIVVENQKREHFVVRERKQDVNRITTILAHRFLYLYHVVNNQECLIGALHYHFDTFSKYANMDWFDTRNGGNAHTELKNKDAHPVYIFEPAFQNRGLGTLLFYLAIRRAIESDRAKTLNILNTRIDPPAYYRNLGFKSSGRGTLEMKLEPSSHRPALTVMTSKGILVGQSYPKWLSLDSPTVSSSALTDRATWTAGDFSEYNWLEQHGIAARHAFYFQAFAMNYKFVVMVRAGNPDGLRHFDNPVIIPKGPSLKAKTALVGENLGLAVNPTHPIQAGYWDVAIQQAKDTSVDDKVRWLEYKRQRALLAWEEHQQRSPSKYEVNKETGVVESLQTRVDGLQVKFTFHSDYDLHAVFRYVSDEEKWVHVSFGTGQASDIDGGLHRGILNRMINNGNPIKKTFIRHGDLDSYTPESHIKTLDLPVVIFLTEQQKPLVIYTAEELRGFYTETLNSIFPYENGHNIVGDVSLFNSGSVVGENNLSASSAVEVIRKLKLIIFRPNYSGMPSKEGLLAFAKRREASLPLSHRAPYRQLMAVYSFIEVAAQFKYLAVPTLLGSIVAGSLLGSVVGFAIYFIGGFSRFIATIYFTFKYPKIGMDRLVHPLLLVPHVGFFFGLLRTYFPGLTLKELRHLRNIHYKVILSLHFANKNNGLSEEEYKAHLNTSLDIAEIIFNYQKQQYDSVYTFGSSFTTSLGNIVREVVAIAKSHPVTHRKLFRIRSASYLDKFLLKIWNHAAVGNFQVFIDTPQRIRELAQRVKEFTPPDQNYPEKTMLKSGAEVLTKMYFYNFELRQIEAVDSIFNNLVASGISAVLRQSHQASSAVSQYRAKIDRFVRIVEGTKDEKIIFSELADIQYLMTYPIFVKTFAKHPQAIRSLARIHFMAAQMRWAPFEYKAIQQQIIRILQIVFSNEKYSKEFVKATGLFKKKSGGKNILDYFDTESRQYIQTKFSELVRILDDPSKTADLVFLLSILRLIYYDYYMPLQVNEHQLPLEYAKETGYFVALGRDLYVAPISESFRRHILFRMDSNGQVTDAVEIFVPGERTGTQYDHAAHKRYLVDLNRYLVAKDMFTAYEDSGIVKPLVMAEYPGVRQFDAYGETILLRAQETLRVIVFDYSEENQGHRIVSETANISEAYIARILRDNNMEREQLFNAMLKDMIRIVYQFVKRGFVFGSLSSTDMHPGNFRLTRKGRIKQVGDLSSLFKESVEPKPVVKLNQLYVMHLFRYIAGDIYPVSDRTYTRFEKEVIRKVTRENSASPLATAVAIVDVSVSRASSVIQTLSQTQFRNLLPSEAEIFEFRDGISIFVITGATHQIKGGLFPNKTGILNLNDQNTFGLDAMGRRSRMKFRGQYLTIHGGSGNGLFNIEQTKVGPAELINALADVYPLKQLLLISCNTAGVKIGPVAVPTVYTARGKAIRSSDNQGVLLNEIYTDYGPWVITDVRAERIFDGEINDRVVKIDNLSASSAVMTPQVMDIALMTMGVALTYSTLISAAFYSFIYKATYNKISFYVALLAFNIIAVIDAVSLIMRNVVRYPFSGQVPDMTLAMLASILTMLLIRGREIRRPYAYDEKHESYTKTYIAAGNFLFFTIGEIVGPFVLNPGQAGSVFDPLDIIAYGLGAVSFYGLAALWERSFHLTYESPIKSQPDVVKKTDTNKTSASSVILQINDKNRLLPYLSDLIEIERNRVGGWTTLERFLEDVRAANQQPLVGKFSGLSFLVIGGNTALGYLFGILPNADYPYASIQDSIIAFRMGIAEQARGQGLGSLLLKRLAEEALQRQKTYMYLDTREDNQGARRLYQRLGFVERGEHYEKDKNVRYIHYRAALRDLSASSAVQEGESIAQLEQLYAQLAQRLKLSTVGRPLFVEEGLTKMRSMFPDGRPIETNIYGISIVDFPPYLTDLLTFIVDHWRNILPESTAKYIVHPSTYHISLAVPQDLSLYPAQGHGILGDHLQRLTPQELVAIFRQLQETVAASKPMHLTPKGVRAGPDGALILVFEYEPDLYDLRQTLATRFAQQTNKYSQRPKLLIHITLARVLENIIPDYKMAVRIRSFAKQYESVAYLLGHAPRTITIDTLYFSHETRWMQEENDFDVVLKIGEQNSRTQELFEAHVASSASSAINVMMPRIMSVLVLAKDHAVEAHPYGKQLYTVTFHLADVSRNLLKDRQVLDLARSEIYTINVMAVRWLYGGEFIYRFLINVDVTTSESVEIAVADLREIMEKVIVASSAIEVDLARRAFVLGAALNPFVSLFAGNEKYEVDARSAMLVDINSSEIKYGKNIQGLVSQASTKKIMTALLILELLPMDKIVTILEQFNVEGASRIYLRKGEKYYARDLFIAMLVRSANDAAIALAQAVAGSETAFVELMNKRAKELGANNTVFANSNGMPTKEGVQHTTAFDMYLIFREVLKHALFRDVIKMGQATITSFSGRKIKFKSTNPTLTDKKWKHKLYGKTGWTKMAGPGFVGYLESGNAFYVISYFGAPPLKRWDEINMIFKHYADIELMKAPKITRNKRASSSINSVPLNRLQGDELLESLMQAEQMSVFLNLFQTKDRLDAVRELVSIYQWLTQNGGRWTVSELYNRVSFISENKNEQILNYTKHVILQFLTMVGSRDLRETVQNELKIIDDKKKLIDGADVVAKVLYILDKISNIEINWNGRWLGVDHADFKNKVHYEAGRAVRQRYGTKHMKTKRMLMVGLFALQASGFPLRFQKSSWSVDQELDKNVKDHHLINGQRVKHYRRLRKLTRPQLIQEVAVLTQDKKFTLTKVKLYQVEHEQGEHFMEVPWMWGVLAAALKTTTSELLTGLPLAEALERMNFGQRINLLRLIVGLTRLQLSEKIGVDPTQRVTFWIENVYIPSLKDMRALIAALGADEKQLFALQKIVDSEGNVMYQEPFPSLIHDGKTDLTKMNVAILKMVFDSRGDDIVSALTQELRAVALSKRHIGERIELLRMEKGLTYGELATKLQEMGLLKIGSPQVRYWIKNRRTITKPYPRELAIVLEKIPGELFDPASQVSRRSRKASSALIDDQLPNGLKLDMVWSSMIRRENQQIKEYEKKVVSVVRERIGGAHGITSFVEAYDGLIFRYKDLSLDEKRSVYLTDLEWVGLRKAVTKITHKTFRARGLSWTSESRMGKSVFHGSHIYVLLAVFPELYLSYHSFMGRWGTKAERFYSAYAVIDLWYPSFVYEYGKLAPLGYQGRKDKNLQQRWFNLIAQARAMANQQTFFEMGLTTTALRRTLAPEFIGSPLETIRLIFPELKLPKDIRAIHSQKEAVEEIHWKYMPNYQQRYEALLKKYEGITSLANRYRLMRGDKDWVKLRQELSRLHQRDFERPGLKKFIHSPYMKPYFNNSYVDLLISAFPELSLNRLAFAGQGDWTSEQLAVATARAKIDLVRPDLMWRYDHLSGMDPRERVQERASLMRSVVALLPYMNSEKSGLKGALNVLYFHGYIGLLIAVFSNLDLKSEMFISDWSSHEKAILTVRSKIQLFRPHIVEAYARLSGQVYPDEMETRLLRTSIRKTRMKDFKSWGLTRIFTKIWVPYFNGSHAQALMDVFPALGLKDDDFKSTRFKAEFSEKLRNISASSALILPETLEKGRQYLRENWLIYEPREWMIKVFYAPFVEFFHTFHPQRYLGLHIDRLEAISKDIKKQRIRQAFGIGFVWAGMAVSPLIVSWLWLHGNYLVEVSLIGAYALWSGWKIDRTKLLHQIIYSPVSLLYIPNVISHIIYNAAQYLPLISRVYRERSKNPKILSAVPKEVGVKFNRSRLQSFFILGGVILFLLITFVPVAMLQNSSQIILHWMQGDPGLPRLKNIEKLLQGKGVKLYRSMTRLVDWFISMIPSTFRHELIYRGIPFFIGGILWSLVGGFWSYVGTVLTAILLGWIALYLNEERGIYSESLLSTITTVNIFIAIVVMFPVLAYFTSGILSFLVAGTLVISVLTGIHLVFQRLESSLEEAKNSMRHIYHDREIIPDYAVEVVKGKEEGRVIIFLHGLSANQAFDSQELKALLPEDTIVIPQHWHSSKTVMSLVESGYLGDHKLNEEDIGYLRRIAEHSHPILIRQVFFLWLIQHYRAVTGKKVYVVAHSLATEVTFRSFLKSSVSRTLATHGYPAVWSEIENNIEKINYVSATFEELLSVHPLVNWLFRAATVFTAKLRSAVLVNTEIVTHNHWMKKVLFAAGLSNYNYNKLLKATSKKRNSVRHQLETAWLFAAVRFTQEELREIKENHRLTDAIVVVGMDDSTTPWKTNEKFADLIGATFVKIPGEHDLIYGRRNSDPMGSLDFHDVLYQWRYTGEKNKPTCLVPSKQYKFTFQLLGERDHEVVIDSDTADSIVDHKIKLQESFDAIGQVVKRKPSLSAFALPKELTVIVATTPYLTRGYLVAFSDKNELQINKNFFNLGDMSQQAMLYAMVYLKWGREMHDDLEIKIDTDLYYDAAGAGKNGKSNGFFSRIRNGNGKSDHSASSSVRSIKHSLDVSIAQVERIKTLLHDAKKEMGELRQQLWVRENHRWRLIAFEMSRQLDKIRVSLSLHKGKFIFLTILLILTSKGGFASLLGFLFVGMGGVWLMTDIITTLLNAYMMNRFEEELRYPLLEIHQKVKEGSIREFVMTPEGLIDFAETLRKGKDLRKDQVSASSALDQKDTNSDFQLLKQFDIQLDFGESLTNEDLSGLEKEFDRVFLYRGFSDSLNLVKRLRMLWRVLRIFPDSKEYFPFFLSIDFIAGTQGVLQFAFGELSANAIDASLKVNRKVRIRIKVYQTKKSLILEVWDNGIAIDFQRSRFPKNGKWKMIFAEKEIKVKNLLGGKHFGLTACRVLSSVAGGYLKVVPVMEDEKSFTKIFRLSLPYSVIYQSGEPSLGLAGNNDLSNPIGELKQGGDNSSASSSVKIPAHWKKEWENSSEEELERARAVLRRAIFFLEKFNRLKLFAHGSSSFLFYPESGSSDAEKFRTLRAMYFLHPDFASAALGSIFGQHARWLKAPRLNDLMLPQQTIELDLLGQMMNRVFKYEGLNREITIENNRFIVNFMPQYLLTLLSQLVQWSDEAVVHILSGIDDGYIPQIIKKFIEYSIEGDRDYSRALYRLLPRLDRMPELLDSHTWRYLEFIRGNGQSMQWPQ